MAKELPYFKFFVSEWSDGDITLEDYEVQGLFINICSYYWSKDCDVSLIKLRKRFKGCDKSIDILIESEIIHVDNGSVQIKFLLEQLEERGELSNKNSLNAKKRWDAIKKAKQAQTENDASALPSHCEKYAIKRREEEEKKREEKKSIIITPIVPIEETKKLSVEDTFNLFWNHFHKKTNKPKEKKKPAFTHWKKLNLEDQRKAYSQIEAFSNSNPDKDYLPICRTYLADRVFDDEFIIGKVKIPAKETYEQTVSRICVNKRQTF